MTYRSLVGNAAAAVIFAMAFHTHAVEFSELNETFGIPIWADANLWDDRDVEVAQRLQWPPESRTTSDSSFRIYTKSDTRVLGTRPFSMVMHGSEGSPDQISMVFANKGDSSGTDEHGRPVDFNRLIAADTRAITDRLTALLGPPGIDKFGQGQGTSERVSRWDWNGHTILLAAPRGEYVAVRIVPTSAADQETVTKLSDAELREKLKARIIRRDNGDVLLGDIPMVDQGPKGYCVPATWERALRYMGVPADMYVLAMAGQTKAGGGTNTTRMAGGASNLLQRHGRRLVTTGGRVSVRSVARIIDEGLPILWRMRVERETDRAVSERSALRRKATDWDEYKESLKPVRREARKIKTDPDNGHVCMIIGYNADTQELAISDSWGPAYAERWITIEEAEAIDQREFMIVNW